MKKHASIFFTLILLCAVGFIICGIMMDWFTTEDTVIKPTCTEQGYTLHRGWFGRESQIDQKAPLGHRYRAETTEPTCLDSGSAHYVCTDCGYSYDGEPIPPQRRSEFNQALAKWANRLVGGMSAPETSSGKKGLLSFLR
jgi:hypothetical protein